MQSLVLKEASISVCEDDFWFISVSYLELLERFFYPCHD